MPSRRRSASGRRSSCPSSPKRSILSVHLARTFEGRSSSHSKRGTESSFGSRKKNTCLGQPSSLCSHFCELCSRYHGAANNRQTRREVVKGPAVQLLNSSKTSWKLRPFQITDSALDDLLSGAVRGPTTSFDLNKKRNFSRADKRIYGAKPGAGAAISRSGIGQPRAGSAIFDSSK